MSELLVTRTVHINAHRSAVWAAITEPALVSEWFGDTASLELRVGAPGVFGWDEWGEFRIVVEEIDEPTAFAFRWAREKNTDPAPGNSTLVRFILSEKDGGTELTVRETGWEEFQGDVAANMKDNTAGWIEELDELVAFLDKQDSA
ncbi:MAG TPA: SRPBCC domain-containing protein [Galbitalea sp.]|jgi:uncharacterized protein YndB with AHSA1/START domain